MAATSSNLLHTRARENISTGVEIVVRYKVKFDSWTPADLVIEQARRIGPDRVPKANQNLNIEIDGNRTRREDMTAQDFESTPVRDHPGAQYLWHVDVTFRNVDFSLTGQIIDAKLAPIQRRFEVFTEAIVKQEPRVVGKNVATGLQAGTQIDGITVGGGITWPFTELEAGASKIEKPKVRPPDSMGRITNAAGYPYSPVETLQTRLPVLVFKKNVLNPFSWINTHFVYENKLNNASYDLFGLELYKIKKRRLMFWYMNTEGPFYHEQLAYYHLYCRLIYDPDEHVVQVANEGPYVWRRKRDKNGKFDTPEKWRTVVPDCAGVPCPTPIAMSYAGTLRGNQTKTQTTLKFRDLTEIDFSDLTQVLRGRKAKDDEPTEEVF